MDELYRAAAKNHELETAYYAERVAQRSRRSDDDRARRESVAEAFFADKGQRAIAHPPPSPMRCYVVTDRGRLLFDVTADQGLAKEVPPEAHRRFPADLRAKEERNQQDRAEQLALHEEKKQFIADWVAANGTDEQKTRQAAGVLPMAEALEGITDQAFAVNGRLPLYTRDGADRLQRFLRESMVWWTVVAPSDVQVRSVHAVKATADAVGGCPGLAEFSARRDRRSARARSVVEASSGLGIFDGVRRASDEEHGPFVLRREYMVDDLQQAAVGSIEKRHGCV